MYLFEVDAYDIETEKSPVRTYIINVNSNLAYAIRRETKGENVCGAFRGFPTEDCEAYRGVQQAIGNAMLQRPERYRLIRISEVDAAEPFAYETTL